jgi:AcrR family transcriptional regulator
LLKRTLQIVFWNVNYNFDMDMSAMGARTEVTPNHRGVRSRAAVLDAAESLMAEQGYDAASVAALVERAGVPPSSIYHYFGSKEGVLLAVMERGAERFFEVLPDVQRRTGTQAEHLRGLVEAVAATLEAHPDFLRILVVMAAQPPDAGNGEVHEVVNRVRELALVRPRGQMHVTFGLDAGGREADELSRFALATVDGAFVAHQARPQTSLAELLGHLPVALIAIRRDIARRP